MTNIRLGIVYHTDTLKQEGKIVIMTHYVNMQQFIRPHCTKQLITQCRFVQLLQWQPECKIVIYVITCFYSNISNEVDIVSEALSFQELVSHARWRLSKALLVCDQITKDGIVEGSGPIG